MGSNIRYALNMYHLKVKNGLTGQLLFFFIWPFGALLHSLLDMKSRNFIIIYSLFCVLFCWNLDVVSRSYDDLSGMASIFMNADSSTSAFFKRFYDYITFSPNATREIYTYFMMWFTRLFSDNPHAFFAICSIPYLFFQTKCFKMILEDERFVGGLMGVLVIFLFMFPRDIITIQNPRFTTAVWLCVYVILKQFQPTTKSNKHLLWLLLAPTIHSSFWFIAAVILLCIYVGKTVSRPGWLIGLVYISIPFSFLSSELVLRNIDILSFLPFSDALNTWAIGNLLAEAKKTEVSGIGFSMVPVFFDFIKTIAYLFVPIVLVKNKEIIRGKTSISRMVSCYLFIFAIANFIQIIPVLGARFYWIVQILSIYVLFKVYGFKSTLFYFILFAVSWDVFVRYFMGGAVSRVVPLIIFYTPLPYLIVKYWGLTKMDVVQDAFHWEDYY